MRQPRGRWLHLLSRLVLPTGTKGPLLSRLPDPGQKGTPFVPDWRSRLGNRDNRGFPTGTNQRFCSSDGKTFENCLINLEKVFKRCKEVDLVLNWEKCHFMVREGIVLGHLISERGIEVDKAKIQVI